MRQVTPSAMYGCLKTAGEVAIPFIISSIIVDKTVAADKESYCTKEVSKDPLGNERDSSSSFILFFILSIRVP